MLDIMQSTAGTSALKTMSFMLEPNSLPAGILAGFP